MEIIIAVVLVIAGLIAFGSFMLFRHFIKKETGVEKLSETTWFVTFLAALSVPEILFFLIKNLVKLVAWMIA